MPDGPDHERYDDVNGVVLFKLDPTTGFCLEATVYARRAERQGVTHFAMDSPQPFLPTQEARRTWARSKLAEPTD